VAISLYCLPGLTRLTQALAVASVPLIVPAAAGAQEAFPNRVIRIVLPVAPGGGTDQLSRLIGQGFTERWGRQVVVENRPGAGTIIASEIVAKAKPGGHTLLVTTSTHTMNALVTKKMPYDTVRDFAPISQCLSLPSLLVAHPSFARSVKEVIAIAKARPGEILHGSAGKGSNPHLAMALFAHMAQIQMTHVPYKSGPPALIDLLAGHIALTVSGISSSVPHVRAGKLRALGVTGSRRSHAAPEVPTIAEAGVPGYEAMQWYGLLTPAGTPSEVIAMLYRETAATLRVPATAARLSADGSDVVVSTPEAFGEFIKSEIGKWAKVAKTAGLTAE